MSWHLQISVLLFSNYSGRTNIRFWNASHRDIPQWLTSSVSICAHKSWGQITTYATKFIVTTHSLRRNTFIFLDCSRASKDCWTGCCDAGNKVKIAYSNWIEYLCCASHQKLFFVESWFKIVTNERNEPNQVETRKYICIWLHSICSLVRNQK